MRGANWINYLWKIFCVSLPSNPWIYAETTSSFRSLTVKSLILIMLVYYIWGENITLAYFSNKDLEFSPQRINTFVGLDKKKGFLSCHSAAWKFSFWNSLHLRPKRINLFICILHAWWAPSSGWKAILAHTRQKIIFFFLLSPALLRERFQRSF